jgi:hypothetical protein
MQETFTNTDIADYCVRCGRTESDVVKLERHHIIHKEHGGTDDLTNLTWLCHSCHKYQHAKEKIIKSRDAEIQQDRRNILEHRLIKLEELNTIELIKEGEYKTYFEIYSEPLPRKQRLIPTNKIKQPQLSLIDE